MKDDLIGLEVLQEHKISCGDCGNGLAWIVLTEGNDRRTQRGLRPCTSKYKVIQCNKCGGSSFETQEFEGSVSIASYVEEFDLDAVDTGIAPNGTVFCTLKVIKR